MRFHRQRSTFMLTLLAAAASSAAAAPSDYTVKETRALIYDFAKCVVAKHHAKASEALLRNVDNVQLIRQYGSLIDGQCLVEKTQANAKMSFAGDLYRYALADALVEREFKSTPAPELSDVPRLTQRPLPSEPQQPANPEKKANKRRFAEALKNYEEAKAFDYLASYGECVVRAGPSQVKAVLESKPSSPEEHAHFQALQPALGRCVPEAEKLQFGKVALRGALALSYYRLAHAAAR